MIYIRADGNPIIGSGHIMRCLSIAKALLAIGEESVFITADKYPEELIHKQGFKSICLNSDWENVESESDKLDCLICSYGIKKILIDSYRITSNYINHIHGKTQIVYIDDLEDVVYSVDLLINYSISADKNKYINKYPISKLLIGTDFIPLRDQFQEKRHIFRDEVKDILITTGGSDSLNVTVGLIKNFKSNPQLGQVNLHIVVGTFNINNEEILHLSKLYNNIFIYQNIDTMADLMSQCDMAVSAGGTTLYELCACTVPTVAFTFADNQISGTKALAENGLLRYAGDARINLDLCILNIMKNVQELSLNLYERKCMMDKMHSKVDGYGANRIAKEILVF